MPEFKSTAQPIALPVNDAAKAIGIGRTKMFALLQSGEVPICKIGRRTLILTEDLQSWMRQQRKSALA